MTRSSGPRGYCGRSSSCLSSSLEGGGVQLRMGRSCPAGASSPGRLSVLRQMAALRFFGENSKVRRAYLGQARRNAVPLAG